MARAELSLFPSRAPPQLDLPVGFRFCPTDEELVFHYLSRKSPTTSSSSSSSSSQHEQRINSDANAPTIISDVELYNFDPWNLPDRALFGEHEWYFFTPRDRKYPNGSRPNRAAGSGYWKATGADRAICGMASGEPETATTATTTNGKQQQQKKKKKKVVGIKKALVFYKGKAPNGVKTNWIMHEYRLSEAIKACKVGLKRKLSSTLRLDDWVLCRIYKKRSVNSDAAQLIDASLSSDEGTSRGLNIMHHDYYNRAMQKIEDTSVLQQGLQPHMSSAVPSITRHAHSFAGSCSHVARHSTASYSSQELSQYGASNDTTTARSSPDSSCETHEIDGSAAGSATTISGPCSQSASPAGPQRCAQQGSDSDTALVDPTLDTPTPPCLQQLHSIDTSIVLESTFHSTLATLPPLQTCSTHISCSDDIHKAHLPSPRRYNELECLGFPASPSTYGLMDLGLPSPSINPYCGLMDLDFVFSNALLHETPQPHYSL